MGVLILLMGLLFSSLFVCFFAFNDHSEWYDLYREPFSIDTRETNKMTEELNQRMLERNPEAEPLPILPVVVRNDPGGFDWDAFLLLLTNYAFIIGGIIACGIGFRIMFTGTTVSFDTRQSLVTWSHKDIRRTRTTEYELSQMRLLLHETIIRNPGGFDWKGFAATLISVDNTSILLARNKKMDAITPFVEEFRELTGIDVKDISSR